MVFAKCVDRFEFTFPSIMSNKYKIARNLCQQWPAVANAIVYII